MTQASRIVRTLAVAGALLLAAQATIAAPPPARPPGTPNPKILVIDRAAILRGSAVGQNIMKQVQALTIAAETRLRAQDALLQKERVALNQQLAILSPAAKLAKGRAFDAKLTALRQNVQTQQGLIQGGVLKARMQVEQALGPILQSIMTQRGANLLLDRNAVVLGTVDVDITGAAIAILNQKLPTVKVVPTPLPAGAAAPQ